jgi:dTDP-4-amino-4,6-dideoxygalactose transaminase
MICNHGAKKKYYHEIIGVNSRLDALQLAILNVKLKYLDKDLKSRIEAGEMYNTLLTNKSEVIAPSALKNSNHTYHQYTIRHHDRDQVIAKLNENGFPQ